MTESKNTVPKAALPQVPSLGVSAQARTRPSIITCGGVRRFCIGVVFLLALIQCSAFPNYQNIVSVLLATFGCLLTLTCILRENVLKMNPLSSFQLLTFSAASQGLPLLATTLDLNPLIYSLKLPVTTFLWVTATQLALLGAHLVYRNALQFLRFTISDHLLRPIGIFERPYHIQIWAMGLIGSAAMVIVYLMGLGNIYGGGPEPGPLIKFIQALNGFTFAPYLIPILGCFYSPRYKVAFGEKLALIIYFGFNLVLALGRNSRGVFLIGLVSVALVAVLAILIGNLPIKRIRWGFLVVCALAIFPVASIVSDLVLAMQIARGQRGHVSTIELIEYSTSIFFDKDRIRSFERNVGLQDITNTGLDDLSLPSGAGLNFAVWGENYTSNPILNRLIFIKFHDNILHLTHNFSETQVNKLRNYTIQRSLSILPTPVLRPLGLAHVKQQSLIGSVGDRIYYYATNIPFFSQRTGSSIGHGAAAYGYASILIVAFFALPIFILSDSLVRVEKRRETRDKEGTYMLHFSFLALLQFYTLSGLFSADSLVAFITFITRGFIQTIFLYWLLFHVTRWLGPALSKR